MPAGKQSRKTPDAETSSKSTSSGPKRGTCEAKRKAAMTKEKKKEGEEKPYKTKAITCVYPLERAS